jgi:hypothetical protein
MKKMQQILTEKFNNASLNEIVLLFAISCKLNSMSVYLVYPSYLTDISKSFNDATVLGDFVISKEWTSVYFITEI